ncbi:MAG: UvrD-helicase domain-containing protein, partial [Clostridia bacterium]|nr:UvrD-helicase domain-containing protein [Clostridia bacterium]
MEFSPAQQNAIYTKGASLLVSAAAGSGKTAVLVERVVQKLLAGGDISRLWIVTYTEAAAGEMRQKIEQAVEQCIEEHPENTHLQQQMLLIPTASISTIHAACKRIIEQNFQILGMDPASAVGEESSLEIMFENLLEDYAEELYAQAETDAQTAEFLAFFSGGKNDHKLFSVLRKAYRFYEEQPFPQTVFPVPSDIFAIFPDELLLEQSRRKME